MSSSGAFADWSALWLDAGSFHGAEVPDEEDRIAELSRLWTSEIPAGWERGADRRVLEPNCRYLRSHRHNAPTRGSEHELEMELLGPDPSAVPTDCLGGRLLDGVNAVPLAKDPSGGRNGNVEADMLLLVEGREGPKLFLVEVKTSSNNAWYAAAESLRQLRLFIASASAQEIMPRRRPELSNAPAVSAIVLAPPDFYQAPGARRNVVAPARRLLDHMRAGFGLDAQLAIWLAAQRTITPVNTSP